MKKLALVLGLIFLGGCSVPAMEESGLETTPTTTRPRRTPRVPVFPSTSTSTTTTTVPVPTTTTTVPTEIAEPVSVAKPPVTYRRIPESLYKKVKGALEYGYGLGYSVVGCTAVLLDYDYTLPETTLAQTITFSNVYTGELVPSECEINFNPDALTGDWEEDYVVYHEVSHLFSSEEREDHGLIFKSVEKKMYTKLKLEVFYYTGSTYPDCFKVKGVWVEECLFD